MISAAKLRAMLSGGDRRSLGKVPEVVALGRDGACSHSDLVKLLWDEDAVVRMRAADALEKLSLGRSAILQPFTSELLGLMAETLQQELRWHLALMVARMELDSAQRLRAAAILESWLEDRSSIVRTFSMQGLWELAQLEPGLLPRVRETIRELIITGTPAMRARGRKLLAKDGEA